MKTEYTQVTFIRTDTVGWNHYPVVLEMAIRYQKDLLKITQIVA